MNPVDLDGASIIVFHGAIHATPPVVLAAGVGSFDGRTFIIGQEDRPPFILTEDHWERVERPLTGFWKERYPEYNWYLEIR
ncbi:hypothetical protein OVA24_09675 [Luteolibacter sp. SL250]|uniref:hypothetical protein n=1 Tax=Luteolibacter sp. SL250 TaxID=2995170 RepID=UPI0022704CCA|nr:hypothetical protein [Luteolibacter sp. SL250]WAC21653.1 hypothetical protein OVA24_09675 [Luteolibacter sp. SL250]